MDIASLTTNLSARDFKDILIAVIAMIGLVWYYCSLIDMGLRPTAAGAVATGFREFQALSVTTISVSLATYVGFVIGIPLQAQPTDALKDKPPIAVTHSVASVAPPAVLTKTAPPASAADNGVATADKPNDSLPTPQAGTSTSNKDRPPEPKVTWLQWSSAALYVCSLVLAVFFYSRTKGTTEPAITGLAKSLLGFVAGVLSVGLNAA